jgi:putative sterol carrier protein
VASALLTVTDRFLQKCDQTHHPNGVIHAVRVMHRPRRNPTIEAAREGWELDPTTEFFRELERRGHEPVLENVTGTLRFDLMNGKRTARWLVAIRKGEIDVSHRNTKADCVVRADQAIFDGIAAGEVNAFAAALRGQIDIEGNTELLVRFQRLFPGPPRSAT